MFEAIANFITGAAALAVTFVILTFPTWLAGKIAASQTRALPVPFFFRPKLLRWATWYLAGIVALVAMVLATRPSGTFEAPTRLVLVVIALAAYGVAAIAAFYISWTASAQRRARKEHDSPPARRGARGGGVGVQAGVSTSTAPAQIPEEVAHPPARPHEEGREATGEPEGDYKPARPAE